MKFVTKNCANCGACIKRCPKNAISFKKNREQEMAVIDEDKCINCGKCFKLCPSNNKKEKNEVTIKVARINNEIDINKSTSGGIFGELARFFLRKNCIVYGAAYDEDFKGVHHMRCDNLEHLDKLLKTKYVRSKLDNIFEEVENDLKEENDVLFSGTPCQIAGLKAYLKKDYDNLYTIDIICHGTPSPYIWKNYANYLEKKEKSKLQKVDFRYLNKEEPEKNLYIEFENGKVINEALYDNAYGRAFALGLTQSNACGHCQFNNFTNYSDLTIGDAWGYYNKQYNIKNSLIIINTKKGKMIYNFIKDNLIEFNDYDIEQLVIANYPIVHPTLNHYNHGRINYNAKNIEKELWHWLDKNNGLEKDEKAVAILNFAYENINFGANLVPYSLSKVLKELGYNPWVIDFDVFKELDAIKKYQSINFFYFREKYLQMTPKYKTKEELNILNNYFDMFITGSDQVFRKYITKNNYTTYFLDFVKNKNKISYAASFGSDEYDGDIKDRLDAIASLSSFYAISVRELAGAKICEEKLDCNDAKVVLDPTLLLTEKDYEEINDESYDHKIDVAAYLMLDFSNKKIYDKHFKRLFKNKIIVNIKGEFIEEPFGKVFKYNHISKWIDGFRKSKYVVTDSYHGLIMGLIHHKNIICVGRKSSSYSRFDTLIKILGGNIEKVMFSSLDEVKSINSITNVLDYEEIDKNIEKYRKKSIAFLKKNLNKDKIKTEDKEFYKEVSEYINELRTLNKELVGKGDELEAILHSKSWKITSPIRGAMGKLQKFRNKK